MAAGGSELDQQQQVIARSERHVVIEGDAEEEWPQLTSINDDGQDEQPLIETKEDDPTDLGLIHPEGLLDDGLPSQAVERVHDMPERTT